MTVNNAKVSNVTVVPVERLADEELELYRVPAEKGRAIPIEATANKAAETPDKWMTHLERLAEASGRR